MKRVFTHEDFGIKDRGVDEVFFRYDKAWPLVKKKTRKMGLAFEIVF